MAEPRVKELTPRQAADIAFGVYNLKQNTVVQAAARLMDLGLDEIFALRDNARFAGRSGVGVGTNAVTRMPILNSLVTPLSGFGYVADGINDGPFKGHVLIATRGTASLADVFTDFHCGMQSGDSGYQVHIGFNNTWKSYKAELDSLMKGRNPVHVHCVGHSLGGALAMLNAEYLLKGGYPVSVYTFGAPRVGSENFARNLTQKMAGKGNIYRVSHIADPVPMIPTFPFVHAPYCMPSYVIGSGLINFAKHKMAKSYIPAVKELDWGSFPTDALQQTDQQVETWLASANGAGAVKMYSAHALQMIGQALRWLLKKAGLAIGIGVTAFTGAFTLLDRIAWMIEKAVELDKQLGDAAKSLMRAVMRFLGRTVDATQQLTRAYFRWVFGLLFSTLSAFASIAVRQVGENE